MFKSNQYRRKCVSNHCAKFEYCWKKENYLSGRLYKLSMVCHGQNGQAPHMEIKIHLIRPKNTMRCHYAFTKNKYIENVWTFYLKSHKTPIKLFESKWQVNMTNYTSGPIILLNMITIEPTTPEILGSQCEAGQIFGHYQTEKPYASICESIKICSNLNLSKIGGAHLQYLCYKCAKFAECWIKTVTVTEYTNKYPFSILDRWRKWYLAKPMIGPGDTMHIKQLENSN